MDRRIVAGLVAFLVTGLSEVSLAQSPSRDPSGQPAVGIAPIRSINDSINDTSTNPTTVPFVTSKVPTNPIGTGPAAAIPNPPVLNEPISMTPIESLHPSLSRGFGTGRIASLFRKPGARPTTPSSTTPVRYLPSLGATTSPPTAFSRFPPLPTLPPDLPTTTARPSPYAGQAPETARPQADPVVAPASGDGRPAPYVNQHPASPRPQGPTDGRTPGPRPQFEPAPTPVPTTEPTPKPVEAESPVTIPVELPAIPLPPPPPLDPSPGVAPVTPEPAGGTTPGAAVAPATPEPAPVPVGSIEPAPAGLPALESIDATAKPAVVAVEPPPEGLPDLAVVLAQAKVAATSTGSQPGTPNLVDDQVRRTSTDQTALQIKDAGLKRDMNFITYTAASVGDEIITINELKDAVKLQMAEYPGLSDMPQNTAEFRNLMNQVAATTLNHLIDQRLILQEAKWKMKGKAKAEEMFNEFIDNLWKSEELPVLYRQYQVLNVHELKIKMREKGQNYDTKKEIFRKREMAKNFLSGEIRHRVTHDMIDLREYYDTHRNDFIKPARITWREIEVNVSRYPDRATARKKAEDLLSRLLHNESFEAIAKANSNGPTASQGGVYVDMTPGSYGIASVNDELNHIPIGQISPVIEAPNSFHIIRVDSRREKGPLRFDEVQDKVNEMVLMDNYQKAVTEYLAKLRAKTVIRTMFESTQDGLIATGGQGIIRPAGSK